MSAFAYGQAGSEFLIFGWLAGTRFRQNCGVVLDISDRRYLDAADWVVINLNISQILENFNGRRIIFRHTRSRRTAKRARRGLSITPDIPLRLLHETTWRFSILPNQNNGIVFVSNHFRVGECMSSNAGYAVNPLNGAKVQIYEGWNWPAFFFGLFWCMAKGLWKQAAIVFLVVIISMLIPVLGWLVAIGTWFYLGANGNEMVVKSVVERGYTLDGGAASSESGPARVRIAQPSIENANIEDLGKLERLHALHQAGALTDEEFAEQKNRFLKS